MLNATSFCKTKPQQTLCSLGYLFFSFPFKCGGRTFEIGIFSFSEEDFPSGSPDGQSWWVWEMEKKEERLPQHFFLFLMTKDHNRVCCCVQLWWVGFFFFLRFGVLTSDGTWRNCNCWPYTISYLLGSQTFNLAPGVNELYRVFMITEYYLSWKKLSPKMECSCSIKELFGFILMFFANYVVIFNILEDTLNCRKLPYFLYRCLKKMLGTLLLLLAELHTCRNTSVAILCKSLCLPFPLVKALLIILMFVFFKIKV